MDNRRAAAILLGGLAGQCSPEEFKEARFRGADALAKLEPMGFELAIYKQACTAKDPEGISDATHTMMNAAAGNVSGLFEEKYGPCEAIRRANILLQPAWDAWQILMNRLEERTGKPN